tara:strand:- start:418 stop:693 length:276 start_codon:yes stop_codon:yes gene_type:complete
MSRNKKRYAVVIDTYVYAENDYMARKKAHDIKRGIVGDHSRVIEINECPFASIETRALDNIGEPLKLQNNQNKVKFEISTSKWTDKDPLPF